MIEDFPAIRDQLAEHWQKIGVDLVKDRKSTRLNSSHANISYAVFCLKKKKKNIKIFKPQHKSHLLHHPIITKEYYLYTITSKYSLVTRTKVRKLPFFSHI